MKFEVNFSKLKPSKWVGVFIIGVLLGAVIATVSFELKHEVPTTACLTTTDLNRSDMSAVIVLSRFCEGMGLQSSVYWQRDMNGNVYGLPICLEARK